VEAEVYGLEGQTRPRGQQHNYRWALDYSDV
jgi:hypothetical protein